MLRGAAAARISTSDKQSTGVAPSSSTGIPRRRSTTEDASKKQQSAREGSEASAAHFTMLSNVEAARRGQQHDVFLCNLHEVRLPTWSLSCYFLNTTYSYTHCNLEKFRYPSCIS